MSVEEYVIERLQKLEADNSEYAEALINQQKRLIDVESRLQKITGILKEYFEFHESADAGNYVSIHKCFFGEEAVDLIDLFDIVEEEVEVIE